MKTLVVLLGKGLFKPFQTLTLLGFFYFPTKNNGCRHVKTELNKSAFDLKSKKRVFHNLSPALSRNLPARTQRK